MRDAADVLLVVGVLGLSACSKGESEATSSAQQSATNASVPNGEVVDVWLEDEHSRKRLNFRVPRDYLSRKYMNNSGGKQLAMVIETGLPELQPRPAVFWIAEEAKKVGLAEANEKLRNGVLIALHGEALRSDYGMRTYARYMTTYHRDPSLDIVGLNGYSGNTCHEVEQGERWVIQCMSTNEDELYFPTQENHDSGLVFMTCIRPSQNDGGGCTPEFVSRGMRLLLIFRSSELSRWWANGVRPCIVHEVRGEVEYR